MRLYCALGKASECPGRVSLTCLRDFLFSPMPANSPTLPQGGTFLPGSDANRILIELCEQFAYATNIAFQHSHEEFLSNHAENECQVPSYPLSLCCGFKVGKPPVARIDVARKQTALLEAVDKPCDHTFVSSELDGELSGSYSSSFYAAKKNACFLHGHPKFQEAAV
jgi:hypothetical protein